MKALKSILFFLVVVFFATTLNSSIFEPYREDLKNIGFENLVEQQEFPLYLQKQIKAIAVGTGNFGINLYPPEEIGSVEIDYVVIHERLFLAWVIGVAEYDGKKVLVAHLDTHILTIQASDNRRYKNKTILNFISVTPGQKSFFVIIEVQHVRSA